MNDNNFWLWIDRISNIAQLESYQILLEDFNNTDLMQELQKQDTQYFETIIKNQEEILKLLKERSE